jgi:hypothetical protein
VLAGEPINAIWWLVFAFNKVKLRAEKEMVNRSRVVRGLSLFRQRGHELRDLVRC